MTHNNTHPLSLPLSPRGRGKRGIAARVGGAILIAVCSLMSPALAQDMQRPARSIPLPEDHAAETPPAQQQAPRYTVPPITAPPVAAAPDTKTLEVTPPVDTSVVVSPPGCDFQITFPEKPYNSTRCPEGGNGQCYDLARYTMVYDMSTTVDVRFSCNKLMPGQFEQYNEQVSRMALNGMAARNNVRESTTNFSQDNQVKRTVLSGAGVSGQQDKIYIAQIWTSPQSILTLEAELIGPQHHQADAVFGEILRSIQVKETETAKEPATPDSSDIPSD